MQGDQIFSQLPDAIEALTHLNNALLILDFSGFSLAAIHVDTAINCIHDALPELPRTITNLDFKDSLDFSTMDRMASNMIFEV